MKKIILLQYITALAFAACFVQPALAHAGEPRLEISVERINPGGTIEVRGVDFDYEQSIALSLMHANAEIPLDDATADMEGTFTQTVVLPTDLPTGEYNFRAKTDHEVVMSPILTVWGVAVEDQESTSIQDQSDVQLEPIPSPTVGVDAAVPQVALPGNNAPPQSSFNPLIWMIAAGLAIAVLAGLVFRMKR